MSLYEMMEHAHGIWESTYEPVPGGGGTLIGWMMRQQRLGSPMRGGTFQVGKPGEK